MTTIKVFLVVFAVALLVGLTACDLGSEGVLPEATPIRQAIETPGNEYVPLPQGSWLVQNVGNCRLEVPEGQAKALDSFDGLILTVAVAEAPVYVRCPEVHTEPVVRFVPRP